MWDVADGLDAADLLADVPGIGAALALVVLGVGLGLLAVFFVFPAVVLLLEVILVVVIAAATLGARALFRRPWMVVARRKGSDEIVIWRVVGFRAAGRAVEELADRVERGDAFWRQ